MIKDAAFGIVPFIIEGEVIKYLLIHQQKGHWAFPKGHAEPREDELQTAKRELAEETGLVADKIYDHKFVEGYTFTENNQEYDKTVTYFAGQMNTTKVDVQEDEVQGYAWMTLDEAMTTITFDQARGLLQQVDTFLQDKIKQNEL